MPRVCSFGCSSTDMTMHSFPNPEKFPDRFKTWVTLVGGKLETKADFTYYMKKKVCDIHFTDRDKNRNRRLNSLAIPTLHLSGGDKSQVSFTKSPCNIEATTVDKDITSGAFQDNIHIADTHLIRKEHNYSVLGRQGRIAKGTNKDVTYKQVQFKPLHKKVKCLRTEISRLRKQSVSLKSGLTTPKRFRKLLLLLEM